MSSRRYREWREDSRITRLSGGQFWLSTEIIRSTPSKEYQTKRPPPHSNSRGRARPSPLHTCSITKSSMVLPFKTNTKNWYFRLLKPEPRKERWYSKMFIWFRSYCTSLAWVKEIGTTQLTKSLPNSPKSDLIWDCRTNNPLLKISQRTIYLK